MKESTPTPSKKLSSPAAAKTGKTPAVAKTTLGKKAAKENDFIPSIQKHYDGSEDWNIPASV